jgi:peptide-methionine (S)-S-oxide reductase
VGTQYRSEIFYHNEEQKKTAEDYIGLMTAEDTFGKRIVTKISPVSKFYEAEKVHQNYYNDNKSQGYCLCYYSKIDKLKKMFEDKLKNNEERNHGRKRKY